MKKIILNLLLISFWTIGFGQGIVYSLWYETGNGNFLINTFTQQQILNEYVNNLPNSGGGPDTGLQKVIQFYSPKPPPALSIYANAKRTKVNSITNSNIVSLTNDLEIRSSTNDFISSDTMHIALHYDKNKYPQATSVGFFYNSNPDKTFEPLINFNATIPTINQSNGALSTIQQNRIHNLEITSLPTNTIINSILTPNDTKYQNGIMYQLGGSTKNGNIFITLFTYENIEIDDNENFKLVFFDKNGNQLNSYNQDVTNHSKLKSHDPNYEIVNPECLTINDVKNTIADYDIHFQNIGEGPAELVVTSTKLPDNYTVNDIINWNAGTLSGLTNWAIGGTSRNISYTVKASSDATGNILIITFTRNSLMLSLVSPTDPSRSPNEVLVGTRDLPNPLHDERTMGEFQFKLKLKNVLSVPIDLTSHTDIKFDSNTIVQTNVAIIRVRNCCKCPEKDSNNNENNNKHCRWKSKFLQWLLCEDC